MAHFSTASLMEDRLLEPNKIHILYQDLFLTDMKNDLSEVNITLQKEKENGIHKDNLLKLLQNELQTAKRTIKTYRKVFLQMQRE